MYNKFSTNDLISTKEAAQILGVTPRTLRYWRERKLFGVPFFTADEMHGNTWYYYRERIEQLKAVYRKGILQSIYKLAELNSVPNESHNENTPSPDFQKRGTSRCIDERTPAASDLFTAEQVTKFLGVDKSTLSRWNAEKKFQPLIIDHKGDFLYSREQLTQLKSVYHKGWDGIYRTPQSDFATISSGQNVKQNDNVELPAGRSFYDFFSDPANKIVEKFNVQIYPSKILYIPNDSLSKRLFNLTDEEYQRALVSRETLEVIEKKKHRKFGDITTAFRIQVDDNTVFDLSEPLDQFDFAILCACISEWEKGNRFTTPAIIYRAISGKVNDRTADPSKDQLANILQSVDKLMRTQIGINMTKACENLNYNGGSAFKIASNILPCKRVIDIKINGQTSMVISFDRESPIWEIAASVKNHHVLSCNADLLNVPGQQNTRMNIATKFYVLRRIMETLAHRKQMAPSITFADILKKCRFTNADRMTKLRVRKICLEFFQHLQNKKLIKSFRLNRRDSMPYSISFT